ncbi:hypothetical protein AB0K20_23200 [Micromonospora matsumotoense]|uniref:hypothetical protein n=1 Tax=Micromonospora matsumotoense TaxID=121616 RepID=UPI003427E37F
MTAPLTDTTTSTSTDDAVHITCCDPDTGLCGETVLGDWVSPTTPTDCPLCLLADDMPCGNPDCPDRETAADWVDVG